MRSSPHIHTHTHTAYDNFVQDDDFTNDNDVQDDDFTNDPVFKTGKAFSIIGAVLGYLLFLFSLTFTFLEYPKAYNALFIMTAVLYFFLAVCSGILFVGLAHEVCTEDYDDDLLTQLGVEIEVKCKPGVTGYLAAAAFLFFIGAGTSILAMRNNCLTPRRAQQSNGPPTDKHAA